MVLSMTGFGRGKAESQDFNITVEIKSVNHRYFEYSSRMPRSFQFLDDTLKSLCGQKISRGKVEVSVQYEDTSSKSIELAVNEAYADAYISALHKFAKDYKLKDDIKVSAIVGNTEIFTVKKRDLDEEAVKTAVIAAATAAIDNFIAARAVEGKRLVDDVKSRADFILTQVEFVEQRSPETVREYREKIEQKIKELIGDVQVDEQRLLTETAIYADKIAVAEETVRLRSHIASLCALLDEGGVIGRKLDFIVQEMNRETNTIGSKAQDVDITKTVVDVKSEIEKIREQIQNIE
ncbi:MAG: YicC/YloC family endoribonuclease [Clostridia bacterium]|nr:YicC/YloC family endoribonuclease [Clostridia bacterium]